MKWKPHKTESDGRIVLWECPECGNVIFSESEEDRAEFHKWCGRCGASMVAEQTEPSTEEKAECPFDDKIPCEWVCTEFGNCKYKPKTEPQTERSE